MVLKMSSPPTVWKKNLTQRRKAAKEMQIGAQPSVVEPRLCGFAHLRETTFLLFGGEPENTPSSRFRARELGVV
jgi:hypothetical protein